ncbi:lysophospholipid acyltransferase family protein [Thalassotalea piscium]
MNNIINIINRIWRIFATGFCFAVFGFGAVLLSFFCFPLQKLIYRDFNKRQAVARLTVHYTFKFFIQLMSLLGVGSFNVPNKHYFEQLRGQLILANHPSLIDVVVLISLMPNADCIVKAHLFKNPFIRGVIKNTGYISNSNPDELIDACSRSLAQGNNLIIFPEGTRTTSGENIKFQRGAANIAIRCQASVTNFIIRVSPTTLTKTEKWYQVPQKKFEFNLYVAADFNSKLEFSDNILSKASRVLTRKWQSFFTEELHKYE